MKPGTVLVDVAIGQGGCFETSRPTTRREPTFEVDGITHYCVANMPGAVPITSTYALTNATLPYAVALADNGVEGAIRRDPGLRPGVNVAGRKATHPAVAEGVGATHVPIEERAEEIADLESENAGKPRHNFLEDEIPFMVDNLRYFAGAARNLEGRAAGEYMEGYTSMIRRESIGVVGQITPWNYPLMMAIWKIGPALATGNTIVLKPAETTPITTVKLAELAAEFLSKGVLNVITGHGEPAGSGFLT